jgi:lipopolysaccharide transport system ATP-binding protein
VQALLELGTGFHPEFTGRENIRASLAYQGLPAGAIARKEREIVDFAELGEFVEQPIRTYSAGMYARLAFATATAVEPEILIIDEVLGAGDAYFTGKCIERMTRLTQQAGASVLFVSHDLGSVQRLCDRTLWIDRGRLRMAGATLEVVKEYQATVRRDEELRLQARDRKAAATGQPIVEGDGDVYDTWLFRLIGAAGHAGPPARVRRLLLASGGTELGRIDVGQPMDNDPAHGAHLIDTPGLMDWGPSRRDARGDFREYGAFGGRNGHAPFQFAVPRGVDAAQCSLLVEADAGGPFHVERWVDGSYRRLGTLAGCDGAPRTLPVAGTAAPEAARNADRRDRRRSASLAIAGIDLLDDAGELRQVFSVQQPLATLRLRLDLAEPRARFDVLVSIFRDDGVLLLSACHSVAADAPQAGPWTLSYPLSGLVPAPGAYVVSAGVYAELDVRDNSREQPALAVWDRAVSFRVEPPLHFRLTMGALSKRWDVEVAAPPGTGAVRVEDRVP